MILVMLMFGRIRVTLHFSFLYCVFCFVFILCLHNVASVSVLSILDCQCLWVINSGLPFLFSLTLPVSLGYQFLTALSVFSNVDLSNIIDNSDGFKIVNIFLSSSIHECPA